LNYPHSYWCWQDDLLTTPLAAGAEHTHPRHTKMTVGAVPEYVKMQAAIFRGRKFERNSRKSRGSLSIAAV